MGRSIRFSSLVISVFMCTILMLAHNTKGQSPNFYTCSGGCYNICFLLNGGRYPCYLNCLASCFHESALDNQLIYYCHVGCSAQRCLQLKKGTRKYTLRHFLTLCVCVCDIKLLLAS